jgi:hypothetical protein
MHVGARAPDLRENAARSQDRRAWLTAEIVMNGQNQASPTLPRTDPARHLHLSSTPDTVHMSALQQTPPVQELPLQLTEHALPAHVT